MRFNAFTILMMLVTVAMGSCTVFKRSPKYGLSEGYYQTNIWKDKIAKVYIVPAEDTIFVYSYSTSHKPASEWSDTAELYFTSRESIMFTDAFHFRKNSFDVDVLTIPFKFRPSTGNFPPQLNASFNGAIFLGYRSDIYSIGYSKTPRKFLKRSILHYGYSVGLFTGIGTARIDEYVTNNQSNIQYDGVVNLSGFNAVFGVENVSIGLAIGVDHLLDKNKKIWMSQGRVWFGLSFGLNLN